MTCSLHAAFASGRYVCGMITRCVYRHVSITMKNYRPEMVLGESPRSPLTEGGLAIRVGSFSGKPITPKVGSIMPAYLVFVSDESAEATICDDSRMCISPMSMS